ncbi:Rha family transcriptional regulator [Arsenophonus sp. PmNCSU2021_1]|uniref:Rha family transcriptional regulator n=1 Tax=Arsenophonus sp. PmNCSU2021_1 TaxID=3118989 RepID=UPI002FF11B0B
MTLQLSTINPKVTVHNGKAVTTSQDVADYFGKLHKNVIQKIESLDCSREFMTANFSAIVVKVQAGFNERETKAYEMTKDGFVFLVMGFTGKKAAQFKEAYIAEFNRMEAELHSIPKRRPEAPELLTDNDTRNLAHLVWSMANGFRFERAWTQGI